MNLKKYQNDRTFFIHYACADFKEKHNPMITAIVIKPFGRSQEIFSISEAASRKGINLDKDVSEDTLRDLESDFLRRFYQRVKPRIEDGVTWIHWNMDTNYFSWDKINERIIKIGVEENPIKPNAKDMLDLSGFFQKKYHKKFVNDEIEPGHQYHVTAVTPENRKGKMYNLAVMNEMMRDDFLSGKQEADLIFEGKDFMAIQSSTCRKVYFIEDFMEKDVSRQLEVKRDAPFWARVERSVAERPIIGVMFGAAISFGGFIISWWLALVLFVFSLSLVGWLIFKKDRI